MIADRREDADAVLQRRPQIRAVDRRQTLSEACEQLDRLGIRFQGGISEARFHPGAVELSKGHGQVGGEGLGVGGGQRPAQVQRLLGSPEGLLPAAEVREAVGQVVEQACAPCGIGLLTQGSLGDGGRQPCDCRGVGSIRDIGDSDTHGP